MPLCLPLLERNVQRLIEALGTDEFMTMLTHGARLYGEATSGELLLSIGNARCEASHVSATLATRSSNWVYASVDGQLWDVPDDEDWEEWWSLQDDFEGNDATDLARRLWDLMASQVAKPR